MWSLKKQSKETKQNWNGLVREPTGSCQTGGSGGMGKTGEED